MSSSAPPLVDRVRQWTGAWTRRTAARFGLQGASALDQWRGRILAALLGAVIVFATPTLAFAVYVLSRRGLWAIVALDLVTYVAAAYVLFSARPTYRTRAWVLVASLFSIGALTLSKAGLVTAGPVWLTMAALAAGLLLGVRAGIGIVAANVTFFVVIGIGIARGSVSWAVGLDFMLPAWSLAALTTTTLALSATVSVGVLVNGLEREAEARLRAEAERRRGMHLEALGTLAGGVAHDFNNLLAPILANVELLDATVDGDAREMLADIRTSAERGRDLVRRLLRLRRGEVGASTTCDLSEVVREASRLVRARAAAGVRIDVRVPDAVHVHASGAELHQIVMNLAINSVQAMPAGGVVVLEVEQLAGGDDAPVEGAATGRGVATLRVRDNGSGMGPETLAHVFEPFYTTKSSEGNGLGLPTVLALVESLGGAIGIDSTPGVGTVVTVTLPASREPQLAPAPDREPPLTPESPDAPEASELPEAPRTILLVDDEPIVLETARRVVAALGHEAVALSSPDAAERWFAEHGDRCALVITDYRMPGRTGTQMVAALRARRSSLPAVVVSGFAAEAQGEVRALGAATMLLSKPYAMADLKRAIDSALPEMPSDL